jgi:predicted nucleotidyltransferase
MGIERRIERLPAADARARAARAAAALSRDPRVRLVFLFGSAADPAAVTVRDVDLAVLTEPPLPLDELLRLRADAGEAAGGPVDLISLNDAGVVLAWEVADSGSCLLADPPEAETDFVVRARSRYWDFKPYLDAQWRLTGERLEERLGCATSSTSTRLGFASTCCTHPTAQDPTG